MYYFKQNLKEKDISLYTKSFHLLFKTAAAFYNELVNSKKTTWITKNDSIVLNSKNAKKLGSDLVFSIVNNYNINMKNYMLNQAKDASYNKPSYRKKDSEFFIAFLRKSYKIDYEKRTVEIKLNKKTITLKIAKNFSKKRKDIRLIRLHKEKTGYYIVYEYEDHTSAISGKNVAGIDLGVDALITCYTPINKPLIISGKYLKFINYKYNKKLEKYPEKKEKIYKDRDNKIKSIFNNAIKRLFDYLRYTNTTKIYIGDFSGVKDKIVAKNFYQISYYLLKRKMKDYARKNNVKIYFIREDYTSKTSFLDFEKPEFQQKYLGNREFRGLFITKEGKRVHADINGAAQILSKKVYVKDRENILLKPFFIDLISEKRKKRAKIKSFLEKVYKTKRKREEVYNKFKKNPENFVYRKFMNYDILSNTKTYLTYKFVKNDIIPVI